MSGSLPCRPFSVAGKKLGKDDERSLFPEAFRLVKEIYPRAVMIKNAPGLLEEGFRNTGNRSLTGRYLINYL
ncbi:MAG TPA: hypothetical protein DCW46_09970 [Desulfotomaculum sp.]|nr:hypothetical protein [Desulfotomaculum sp.]